MSIEKRHTVAVRTAVVVATIALLAVATAGFCKPKLGRLLTREEVATAWVGLSEDELYVVRVVLMSSGGGYVGYSFLDDAPVVHGVKSWAYDPERSSTVKILLMPHEGSPITLNGDVVGIKMELTMSQGDWSRHVSLRREVDWLPRWQRLRSLMAEGQ